MSMTERIPASPRRSLTPPEIGAWFDLQRTTVERVHPSWLPGLAAELVVQARSTPTGRRWLANQLSTLTPLLFALPSGVGPASVHELYDVGWFSAVLQEPLERALDLGSLLLAARLRTVVSRFAVTHLRTMLGVERYERALTASPANAAVPAVPRVSTQTSDEADVLVGQVLHHGAHELAAYAARLHPALAQSVKLSFERNWWGSPYPTTLHPDTVCAYLGLTDRPSQPSADREGNT
jgi:hypothetical protein